MWRTLAIVMGLLCASAGAEDPNKVIVTLEGAKGGSGISVNSRPTDDLLLTLGELHAKQLTQVYVLVHEDASLGALWNLLGIIGKVGLPNPKMFVYTEDKGVMQELSFGCIFIFSADAELTLAHGRKTCP
jgi:hypothetical protein